MEALPADLADFSGRQDAVRTGVRVLCERSPHAPAILGVSGPAGVGKTSFAVHLAHVTRRTYPSGRILIRLDVDADNSPRTVLTSCLRALDVPAASIPAELPEQARLLQSHLRQAPFLIVVDGVTHEAQVRPLLDLETRCGVILTSRRRLDGLDSIGHLELSPMSEQESVELIRRTVGPDRTDAMPAHTATLVRYCEGLPLALRICAARLTARPAWTVGDLVARLAAERSRLDWLKTGDRAVRSSFDTTYRQIDELDRRLFRRLGVLNMPTFPAWVAGALLGVDHELGERVLDALGDVRLVEPAGRGTTGPRYQMHNLLRIFARERAAREDGARDTDAALGRALDGWLALVQEVDTVSSGKYVMDPEPAPAWRPPPHVFDEVRADPVAWRETEQPCLVAAVRLAAERDMPQSAWPLAQRSSTYYDTVNQLEGWQSTLRTALDACQRAGDAAGTACMLRHLAEAHSVGGRLDEAHETARAAQRIYARRDHRWGTAVLGPRIAFIHREQGRSARARVCAEDAVRAARAAQEPVALARALTCLA
ncbi:MAG: NB-ARC domain-containing protein, partial [Actinocatenispora sp.]